MARPDDFTLFAQYHLGILPDGTAQFQNVGDLARRYGVTVEAVNGWLAEHQIDARTAEETDYDLAGQHAEVQVLAMLGDPETALKFARHVYAEYRGRLGHKRIRTFEDDNDKTVADKVEVTDIPTKR